MLGPIGSKEGAPAPKERESKEEPKYERKTETPKEAPKQETPKQSAPRGRMLSDLTLADILEEAYARIDVEKPIAWADFLRSKDQSLGDYYNVLAAVQGNIEKALDKLDQMKGNSRVKDVSNLAQQALEKERQSGAPAAET